MDSSNSQISEQINNTVPDIKIKKNNTYIENVLNSNSKDMDDFVPELIWIDYNINNYENNKYKEQLKDIILIKGFKTIEDGLDEIKKIKFKKVFLILSKRMFSDFIIIFEKEKTKICCCLNVIIFTQKSKRAQIEKICNNNEKISSGYLFNKTNIFDNIEDIKEFIINTKNENKKHKKTDHFETINNDNKIFFDEKIDNFEKIENFEELILPIYFHKSIEPITSEEIRNFNYYLLTLYDGNNEIQNLITQFDNIPKMPIEIICKYWVYIYTLEGKKKFYYILNAGLRSENYKLLLPFIKMMGKEKSI